ncbi:YHS domain-containing (seleno)protein [Engelhardtia mirabilis]|uniref:YHS domain protein n=1 Tax=Engelhardtia mirabilis TaxID=2528011 RepID=A0A518BIM6_9BACT|nr:hypothetical protein Pla133_18900 [Planctomycetes bacterium Pla133]QDV01140.1 hypothetical protein Pla86_18890 [Planctomycetes bacterium Pla86]
MHSTAPLTRVAAAGLALALTSCVGPSAGTLPPEAAHFNVGREHLALEGWDPVSYFPEGGGEPVEGSESIETTYRGLIWRFASEDHREQFVADPERFEPAYGGWCAWAMVDGEKVEVDPQSFLIEDGELLLFYDGFWGDTRQMWLDAGPDAHLRDRANREWASIRAID